MIEIVEPEPIIEGYKCGECGQKWVYREEANDCCRKGKIDWTKAGSFELKQVHLDLMKEFYVEWDNCEFGAPGIDPKRPYGNSDVIDDMARIIKLPKKGNYDYEEECWNKKASDKLKDLHRQMQVALQIILSCQSFKPGLYKRKDNYSKDWKFVEVD